MKYSRPEIIRRRAIATGIRTARKVQHTLNREEILALRIQVLPIAHRIVMAVIAVLLAVSARFTWPFHSDLALTVELVASIILILFAIFGVRRTLSNALNKLSFETAELVIKSIFEAICSADL